MLLGYCSIIVRQAVLEHNGIWTCAARLLGREEESGSDFSVNIVGTVPKFAYKTKFI